MWQQECPICFETPVHSRRVLPCKHLFCDTCIGLCLERDILCPLCRRTVCGLSPPRRLLCDQIITMPTGSPQPRYHLGITVANHAHGGVEVVGLCPKDDGVHFFSIGDVITEVNDVPMRTHECAVRLLDEAAKHGLDLRMMIVRKCERRRNVWSCLPRRKPA